MTTLLQEFEEWLRDMKKDDTPNMETVGITIQGALDKLKELKEEYKVEQEREQAFGWLAFQHELNALRQKYNVTSSKT